MTTPSTPVQNVLFYLALFLLVSSFLGMVWFIQTSLTAHVGSGDILSEENFKDVVSSSPSAEAIFQLKNQGILKGYPDNTFQPDKVASRVEALKMLLDSSPLEKGDVIPAYENYIKKEKIGATIVFNDVPTDSWYAPYILKASKLQIISGNPDGSFTATKTVNFSEFLKMLLLLERDGISEEDAKESPFPGIEAHQWFTPYFVRAKALKLLPLPDGAAEMNPSEELTRGKIAVILYQMQQLRMKGAEKFNGGDNLQEKDRMRSYLEEFTGSGALQK